MSIEDLKNCIKVAACVCGKDGIISEAEERMMRQILMGKYPDCDADVFEDGLTEFFDADKQIEDYLALICDDDLRRFTLELAEVSAGVDGLALEENIALEKAYLIWGISRHA